MKLRNKKTGEIIDLDEWSFDTYNDMFYIARGDAEGDNIEYFKSFADFNSKYEDYEEPKRKSSIEGIRLKAMISGRNIIEIDFSNVDEAEKALGKLKAWTRLEDKGFFFRGWSPIHDNTTTIRAGIGLDPTGEMSNDLDLLFGGEDE